MEKKIIINIGRQFGSGGLCIARELGKMLDIPVYDNELIMKAANDSGFSPEFFKRNDEKKCSPLNSFFSSLTGGPTADYMSGNGLFQMQCETIRKIAEQGSCVIVGRCSDYILRDMDCCLNIFITASVEDRIRRTCERGEATPEEAEAFVNRNDRRREDYYNHYTFGNWGVASNYDLCIDSGILGIEGTASFIIDFARKSGLI